MYRLDCVSYNLIIIHHFFLNKIKYTEKTVCFWYIYIYISIVSNIYSMLYIYYNHNVIFFLQISLLLLLFILNK